LLLFWISLGGEPSSSGRTAIRLLLFFEAGKLIACQEEHNARARTFCPQF
jgi:hypothetical protein